VDHGAIARAVRRRQALEALDFERRREESLVAQVEQLVAEEHGAAVDEEAFARMEPDDVAVVRAELAVTWEEPEAEDDGDDFLAAFAAEDDEEDDGDALADELARLEGEIESSRRRQLAFEAYLAALDA
jgi:hypothetical protein